MSNVKSEVPIARMRFNSTQLFFIEQALTLDLKMRRERKVGNKTVYNSVLKIRRSPTSPSQAFL